MHYCLRYGGIDLDGLECVAFFWNPGLHLSSLSARRAGTPRHHTEYLWSLPNHLLARYRVEGKSSRSARRAAVSHSRGVDRPLRLVYVSHHWRTPPAPLRLALRLRPPSSPSTATRAGLGDARQGRGGRVSSSGDPFSRIRWLLLRGDHQYSASAQLRGRHRERARRPRRAHACARSGRKSSGFGTDGASSWISPIRFLREAPRRYARKFVERFVRSAIPTSRSRIATASWRRAPRRAGGRHGSPGAPPPEDGPGPAGCAWPAG